MTDTIIHRGPDDEGIYINNNIGLGFRRLSIIDLKSDHQLLLNYYGNIWITFNGEIYNFKEIRCGLEKKCYMFKTNTDTEVIVNLYEEYGENCVDYLRTAKFPTAFKINNHGLKRILKNSMNKDLPSEILNHPKGFTLPISRWFKKELKEYLGDILLSDSAGILKFVKKKEVSKLINNHLRGTRDLSQKIWSLLFLEVWLRINSYDYD